MYKDTWEKVFEELKLNKDGALRYNTLQFGGLENWG